MQGFIIFDDYAPRFAEIHSQKGVWVRDGKMRNRGDIVDGLESAPQAFIGLLDGKSFGKNFGKLIVKVADG